MALADGADFEALGGNAEADEIGLHRFGAPARKLQVGRARADAVGVAVQFEDPGRILPQLDGDAIEIGARVADQHHASGREKDRGQGAVDRRGDGLGFLFEDRARDEVVAGV